MKYKKLPSYLKNYITTLNNYPDGGRTATFPFMHEKIKGKEKSKMAYYNICPNCGCNLDPGERCDCETKTRDISNSITIDKKSNQYKFIFDKQEERLYKNIS